MHHRRTAPRNPLVRWLPWVSTAVALSMAACGGLAEKGATAAPSSGGASSGGGVTGAPSGGDAGAAGAASGGVAPGCTPSVELGGAATTVAPVAMAVGDFNLDGKPDLAVANHDANSVSVLLGNGDGTFATTLDYATGTNPSSVAAGDFNLDGRLDLAVHSTSSAGVISVLLGNGDGTFAPGVDYATDDGPASLATGDFNLDGRLDLVVDSTSGAGSVSVLLGNGDGTFTTQLGYATPTGIGWLAARDFDLDGRLDVAATDAYASSVAVLLGNGDGTFADKLDQAIGTPPSWVAAGDFNLDGKPDLAVEDSRDLSGTVSVLLGNGDGTFADKVDYARGDGLGPVAVEDFNLDGKPDLALAKSTFGMSGTVSVLLGNGDGTFGARVDYEVQHDWHSALTSMAISDFDLDGKPDIAVTDAFFNTVTVLLARCM